MQHLPKEALFLEFLNGLWSLFSFYLVAWLTYYIYTNCPTTRNKHGYRVSNILFSYWRNAPPYIRVAVATITFHFGDMMVRGSIWWWRHELNVHNTDFWLYVQPIVMIGSMMACIGLLCKVRVFSEPRFGIGPWLSAALIALFVGAWYLIHRH